MLTKDDIAHLGELARIGLSADEEATLASGVDAVLGYVSQISRVETGANDTPSTDTLRNVMREDGDAYAGGDWTEAILANAPHKEDGYFKVGQIF